MESALKKTGSSKYELTVELGHEELESYVKKAESRIIEEVQIDGFRKGKAPKEKVREKVGNQAILEQALDIALQDSLGRVLAEQNLEVMKVADLNIKENSPAKLIYSVAITTFPAIDLPEISKVKVKRKEVSVTPKEIEDALEYVRTSRSKFLAKEGPVEKGDRVEVDFEITSEGLPIEGGISKGHPLVVGDNKFIPGFEDQLIGMKKDEEKIFSLNAPKDYFHKSIAGKQLDFKVKAVTVQTIQKPELNDDFAKQLGRFQALEELTENIKGGIQEEKKVKENQRLRLEILSKILELSKVELPEEMVAQKLDQMITGFDNELHTKGMELSFYLAHLNKTEDDLRKDWRSDAEKQVGYALILRKLAKVKNIQPGKEELDEEVNKTIQSMVMGGQIAPENINLGAIRDAIEGDMTNEKVFEFLEKNCVTA